MREIAYNRTAAVNYALTWALGRNPEYYDYSGIGGDCTSFVSQCVYAGTGVMNYTPDFGWYYIESNNKSPSWSGVEFFYNFMTTNEGIGPFGVEENLSRLRVGDIIQLGNENGMYYHSLIITGILTLRSGRRYYVSAHSSDARQRRLSSYQFSNLRGIHILGARVED